jgi:hypothetical protein
LKEGDAEAAKGAGDYFSLFPQILPNTAEGLNGETRAKHKKKLSPLAFRRFIGKQS